MPKPIFTRGLPDIKLLLRIKTISNKVASRISTIIAWKSYSQVYETGAFVFQNQNLCLYFFAGVEGIEYHIDNIS